ncbi:MAG: tryptophan synthase subunit alpha [Alphaproteobacteria bacterium]|nr:tryptophan synthase subunit alpha [Alphaproteobacteria bacterium]
MSRPSSRIGTRFAALKSANRAAFIPFVTAGDPDLATFAEILAGLPKAGCDVIEIGMPFSDPMADGPAIQQANLRAFGAGIKLGKILGLVADFRKTDDETPIVLMGYANPILFYGAEKFLDDAKASGVDGLILADLPPEEDAEFRAPAQKRGLDFIRLVTPTTDEARLKILLENAGGFLYYVSVAGTTGVKQANAETVGRAIAAIRPHTKLPVAVGFGITTPEQARAIAKVADGVVVGSAIVNRIASNLDADNKPRPGLVADILGFVATLAAAAHGN